MKICIVLSIALALALASPVPPESQQCECNGAARSLLNKLTHIIEKEGKMQDLDLFAGFNCTDLEAKMIPYTQTASVCQPSVNNNSCSNNRNSPFSAEECLKNIRDDLCYYNLMLKSYKPSALDLSLVMRANEELMNCLNQKCESANGGLPEWKVWKGSSFDDRVSLCKTLKGFHIRSITMNRALAYIASGEHSK